ncbi:MAG: amidohydrolase family protein [SAR324 cluster bacterium]|nr:amidohydrolase family protein [SAR324 cluster bacterium]
MNEIQPIDIHSHYFPAAYLKLVGAEGLPFGARCDISNPAGPVVTVDSQRAGPLAVKFTELEPRLEEMDAQGVRTQALSLTQPMVYWAGETLSRRLSAEFNDATARAHEAHPERFVGLATLPMQAPALAIAEVERAAKLPGVRGVYMATRILERELSHPDFFPIFERIEALGLPVFLHPVNVVGMERLRKQFYLNNLLGNPFDTAVAAAHLIFGGVLDRFPSLTVCLPHAGGALPYLVGRLEHGWRVRPECQHLEQGPIQYLRRFYYDTLSHSAEALSYLIGLVGADRVMVGSDYCFDMGCERPVEVVTGLESLSEEEQAGILQGNARRLLGI